MLVLVLLALLSLVSAQAPPVEVEELDVQLLPLRPLRIDEAPRAMAAMARLMRLATELIAEQEQEVHSAMRRSLLRGEVAEPATPGPDVLVRRAVLVTRPVTAANGMTLFRVDVPLHFAPTVPDYTLSVTLPMVASNTAPLYYRTLMADGTLNPWRSLTTGSVIDMHPQSMTKLLDAKAAGFTLLLAVPMQKAGALPRVLVEFAASGWRSVAPMQPPVLRDLSLPHVSSTTIDPTITVVWHTVPPATSSPYYGVHHHPLAAPLLLWASVMVLVVCVVNLVRACRERRMRHRQHQQPQHVEVHHQPQHTHAPFTIPPPVYHAPPPPYAPQAPPPVAPHFQQQQQLSVY